MFGPVTFFLCGYFTLYLVNYFLVLGQIVILIFQIRVNSMAIVCMKSNDDRPPNQFGDTVPGGTALTSTLEQVCVCSMEPLPSSEH